MLNLSMEIYASEHNFFFHSNEKIDSVSIATATTDVEENNEFLIREPTQNSYIQVRMVFQQSTKF